jgi:hypothetical protein
MGPTMLGWSKARLYEIYLFFLTNLVILIKKIFIITKFELKIYDFILNNAIKIFYSIFINGLGRANRVDHWA